MWVIVGRVPELPQSFSPKQFWLIRGGGMKRSSFVLLATVLFAAVTCRSQTYTFSDLVNFPPVSGERYDANAPLTIDSGGNLYGSSQGGGTYGYGTVFKVTPAGVLSTLYNFGTNQARGLYGDGVQPIDNLVRDKAGNLYGVTVSNDNGGCPEGLYGCGVVFKVTSAGEETLLYDLSDCGKAASDFSEFDTPLVLDSAGNLYGDYFCYGADEGSVVFKITPADKFSKIYTDRASSNSAGGPWIISRAGNLYGYGSDSSTSLFTIVELTLQGKLTTVYTFADGVMPIGKLTQDAAGNFFGATYGGGTQLSGSVFEYSAKGVYSTLYSLCSQKNCADGQYPVGFLTLDSSGNLYGLAYSGGTNNDGVVFQVTPSGHESVLYNFIDQSAGGEYGLVMDSSGNLYGVDDGDVACVDSNGTGCIYKLTKN
jgi:uncharacterized repeat protein (TIGR03803 family)